MVRYIEAIYTAIYIDVLCKKTAFLQYRFFTQHIYIYSYIYSFYVADQDTARYIFCSVKGQLFYKNIFCKKRSCPKCCWRIQLVFILKLFSLYKCFLAYFSIRSDAFIVPNSYKRITSCFHGLTSCSVCCKNWTKKQVYVCL